MLFATDRLQVVGFIKFLFIIIVSVVMVLEMWCLIVVVLTQFERWKAEIVGIKEDGEVRWGSVEWSNCFELYEY